MMRTSIAKCKSCSLSCIFWGRSLTTRNKGSAVVVAEEEKLPRREAAVGCLVRKAAEVDFSNGAA